MHWQSQLRICACSFRGMVWEAALHEYCTAGCAAVIDRPLVRVQSQAAVCLSEPRGAGCHYAQISCYSMRIMSHDTCRTFARQTTLEADDLLSVLAPVLKLLGRHILCHLQVLGCRLKILPKRQNIDPCIHCILSALACACYRTAITHLIVLTQHSISLADVLDTFIFCKISLLMDG